MIQFVSSEQVLDRPIARRPRRAVPHARALAAATVLVVEHSRVAAARVRRALGTAGFDVTVAADVARGEALVAALRPDLVILDVAMPGPRNGWALLRALRRSDDAVPVLVISSAASERDRVRGLMLGADDYLAKPVGARELVARVFALLRRARPAARASATYVEDPMPSPAASVVRLGDLAIDAAARTVRRGDRRIRLTATQFDLLRYLAERRDRVVSRAELLDNVFTRDNGAGSRTVDTHVSALRRRLGDDRARPEILHTVWGRGYRFGG